MHTELKVTSRGFSESCILSLIPFLVLVHGVMTSIAGRMRVNSVCVCAPVQQWHSGKLTMSVSDLITDLPPCSPLIFDGPGQWKGHRVVLRDLAQNDSMVCLNPIENYVSHSQMPTGSFLDFQAPDIKLTQTKDNNIILH